MTTVEAAAVTAVPQARTPRSLRDPAPDVRTARAPVAARPATPSRRSAPPASSGQFLRPLLPSARSGFRHRAAPPQDPAPAAPPDHAPVRDVAATRYRALQR